ncbi:putative cadmium-transporting ATPase [bacterium HR17]|uniref:Putative cadmium-transporting ATPase n=1 Tax=Candidatus Fervidibacter japonicus TaxID=2035412 RepID=A0A2H5X921_9BACT|nr:putative cadmium-transporting ATPase [bacterium HR17]
MQGRPEQCCPTDWRTDVRAVWRSREARAALTGALFLVAGWVLAAIKSPLSQWCYFAAALIAGIPIARECVESLRERQISMEVLVTLAVAASLVIGEFHAGAVVAVLLLGGSVLEQLTAARARSALTALLQLVPQTALVRRGGTEREVPISEVQWGDHVLVRVGERIPVDGVVVAGESAVDESPLTGESVPVDKTVGDQVFAGSINLTGVLEVDAQRVGSETTLGRIARLVQEAQASQAPIQRLADRYARWYVPTALALAAIVWAITDDIVRGITVLIVFCPCALVLATPTAVAAAIAHAARRAVLVKGGEFLEAVGQVRLIALDKTGTLTVGKPQVTEIVPLDALSTDALLQLAAGAERLSEHPLGQAICRAASERRLVLPEPDEFRPFAGRGVAAQLNGMRVCIGRLAWLREQGTQVPDTVLQRIAELEAHGRTVLPVAVNNRIVGLIALRDTLRPSAKNAVAALKAMGVKVVMVTGDNERVAKVIAAEAGIDEVHANLLPEDKLRLVREWQQRGLTVAFVGDGVNDAPALAAADIGIAMGAAGTDVAMETADIAILSDDLHKLPELLRLSRRTLRVVWQNIAFSVAVNLGAVIAAWAKWIDPVWGAFIHESSAMAVILNAMRLLK